MEVIKCAYRREFTFLWMGEDPSDLPLACLAHPRPLSLIRQVRPFSVQGASWRLASGEG